MYITELDVTSSVSGQIPDRHAWRDSDIYLFTKNRTFHIGRIRPILGVGLVVFIVSLIMLVLCSKAHVV